MESLDEVKLRVRISASDAHYAGNLVDGAHIMKLFGDVATELTIRYDGDEGLLRAYESVEFLEPVHGGDFLEINGKLINAGNTSRKIAFEAYKIISSANDKIQESACNVLNPSILVAKAIGVSVVTKDKQRKQKQDLDSSDDDIINDFNRIKSGEPSRMSQRNLK